MKRSKKPVQTQSVPAYPEARDASYVNRRRFISLLTAGTASIAVFGAAKAIGAAPHDPRFAPPPPPRPYDPPDHQVPGGMRPPVFANYRLPSHGSWSTVMDDGRYVSYALWIKYDYTEVLRCVKNNSSSIQSYLGTLVRRYLYTENLYDPRRLRKVERKILKKIRRLLPDVLHDDLIAVNLEILREKYIQPLDGDIGIPHYFD